MSRAVQERIAATARRQHGVLTLAQLRDAGLSDQAVRRRERIGILRRLHQGIYLLGAVPAPLGREMAAVLACGRSAMLSHESAAFTWGMVPARPDPVEISVVVVRRRPPKRPRIRARSVTRIDRSERTHVEGIPITTPARSLLDFAAVTSLRELEQAIATAERRGLVGIARLSALVARSKGQRGVRALRQVLDKRGDPALARSEAEERFLSLIRSASLPEPETNVRVSGYEVDFFWRKQRLVVEVDGYRYHSSQSSFEKDRERAAHFASRGIHVVPVTWRQIVDRGLQTIVQIGQALVRDE